MPCHLISLRMADLNQVNTQDAHGRAMACLEVFIGYDNEKGSQLHKVDPAGSILPYKAVAVGKYESEAMNYLEKKESELKKLGHNETIELAIMAMQHVLTNDFKSNEIEIGIVGENVPYRLLTSQEIEERINSISEKADN